MEALFDTKSIPSLLVFIVVFLCANFLKGLVEFAWKLKKEKESASEASVKELTYEIKKFKIDLRRLYVAVKIISGERWSEIKKEIMEDEDAT